MGKKKLIRFAELEHFSNVIEANPSEFFKRPHPLSGNWAKQFFGSESDIVIELGCGKGEYTIGMAMKFPGINFIGVDIKGARIWKGARYAVDNNIRNAGFLRTRIELIPEFFSHCEVAEIWITFPDPQPKKSSKRLTSPHFLNLYRKCLKPNGIINLKTDSRELFDYTMNIINYNKLEILRSSADLYNEHEFCDDILSIKTFYEGKFLDLGKKITYIQFRIDSPDMIFEPDGEER